MRTPRARARPCHAPRRSATARRRIRGKPSAPLAASRRSGRRCGSCRGPNLVDDDLDLSRADVRHVRERSEEHTSELQSHVNLVCRLLLEKKKNKKINTKLSNKTKHKNNKR